MLQYLGEALAMINILRDYYKSGLSGVHNPRLSLWYKCK